MQEQSLKGQPLQMDPLQGPPISLAVISDIHVHHKMVSWLEHSCRAAPNGEVLNLLKASSEVEDMPGGNVSLDISWARTNATYLHILQKRANSILGGYAIAVSMSRCYCMRPSFTPGE